MVDMEKLFRVAFCMARQCWEQAILGEALLESKHTGKEFECVVKNMVVRQNVDGRLCDVENTPAIVDSAFCIPTVLWLGEKNKDAYYLEAARKNFEYLRDAAPRSAEGIIYHIKGIEEVWADGIGYLPYVFAVMGEPELGIQQLHLVLDKLHNPENGLYMQRVDLGTGKVINGEWSVGEGWILTGMVRLYSVLCRQYKEKFQEEKAKLVNLFQTLLDRVLAFETEDHYFHDIMCDPATYKETESGIMVALAIYRGIQANMIDSSYAGRADALRIAAEKKVDEDGYVLDCAGSPTFTVPGASVEGQMHMVMLQQAYKEYEGLTK